MDIAPSPQNCYFNAFKKHWSSIGTICLNVILLTWDMFWYIFLMTKRTKFQFYCLLNLHVGILSNKAAIR